MMVKIALGALDLMGPLFRLMKVDYPKLRNILWARLTVDTRREYINIQVKKEDKSKKGAAKPQNTMAKLLWFHLLAGLFLGFFVLEFKSMFFSMMIVHSFVMLFSVMSVMTHFTAVLLDTSDNTILLPRPVDGRTIFASRMTHILFYVFTVTMTLSLSSWMVGTYKFGAVFFGGFLLTVILSNLMGVFVLFSVYMLILKFSGGEKFKDVIVFIQVILPLVMFLFMINNENMFKPESLMNLAGTWTYFLPPAWFAGMLETLVNNPPGTPYLWHMVLAAGLPLVCLILMVLFLAPAFNRKLSQMAVTPFKKKAPPTKKPLAQSLAEIFGRTPAERTAFNMVWTLAGRDKKYKVNTYSLLGTTFMFQFIFSIVPYKTLDRALYMLPKTRTYVVLLYISCLMLLTAISNVITSDDFKAAWVYRAMPVARPGEILSGALKMVLVKFSVPTLVVSAGILALWGFHVLDDIVFGLLNILLLGINLGFIHARSLPFSQKSDVVGMGGKITVSLLVIVLYIGIAIGHFFIIPYSFAVTAGIVPLALIVLFLFRKYRATPWQKLKI